MRSLFTTLCVACLALASLNLTACKKAEEAKAPEAVQQPTGDMVEVKAGDTTVKIDPAAGKVEVQGAMGAVNVDGTGGTVKVETAAAAPTEAKPAEGAAPAAEAKPAEEAKPVE